MKIIKLARKKEKMWKLYIRNKTNTNLENYKKIEKEQKRK